MNPVHPSLVEISAVVRSAEESENVKSLQRRRPIDQKSSLELPDPDR